MLKADSQHLLGLDLEWHAVATQRAHLDTGSPGDGVVDARHRKTPLFTRLLAVAFENLRIDEHLQLIACLGNIDDDQAHMHVHLGGSETDTGGGIHGLGHVVDEGTQVIIDHVHRLGDRQQTGVRVFEYVEQGHRRRQERTVQVDSSIPRSGSPSPRLLHLSSQTEVACTPRTPNTFKALVIEIMRARHLPIASALRCLTPARHACPVRRLRLALLALALGTSGPLLALRDAYAEEIAVGGPSAPMMAPGMAPGLTPLSPPAATPAAGMPELRLDAPVRYTIEPGDTLWGLASRFLKDPWRWPELWAANRGAVDNPNRLRVGQSLVLDRASTTLAIDTSAPDSNATSASLPTERLSPATRETALDTTAIPAIPLSAIGPFLAQVQITEGRTVPGAQPVSGIEAGRGAAYASQRIYARGLGSAAPGSEWDIVRLGPPLIDPETRRVLASEVMATGLARLVHPGETATLVIVRSDREVVAGDLLVPRAVAPLVLDYTPHAPRAPVSAQVIAIYGGRGEHNALGAGLELDRPGSLDFERRREAGPLQVIVLNRGRAQGLEPGHVLSLHQRQTLANDRSIGPFYLGTPRPPVLQLPAERYGLALVFRTFDQVAYALVVQSVHSVKPGDVLREP